MKKVNLTKQELERQDFVDNQIFELIQKLLPASAQIDWDIETIASIRDIICKEVVGKRIISETQFYPYLKR